MKLEKATIQTKSVRKNKMRKICILCSKANLNLIYVYPVFFAIGLRRNVPISGL